MVTTVPESTARHWPTTPLCEAGAACGPGPVCGHGGACGPGVGCGPGAPCGPGVGCCPGPTCGPGVGCGPGAACGPQPVAMLAARSAGNTHRVRRRTASLVPEGLREFFIETSWALGECRDDSTGFLHGKGFFLGDGLWAGVESGRVC
jgi:hypothetical protein